MKPDQTKPPSDNQQFNVHLSIDALVLDGFMLSRDERDQVGAAMQRELTRLLMEQGVPRPLHNSGEAWRLDGGRISLANSAAPDVIGMQIAGAVYQSLGGEAREQKE